MLVNYVALLPEAVLTAGVLLAVLVRFLRSANTAKTFLTLAKWTILPAMMLTAVFYDRNVGGFGAITTIRLCLKSSFFCLRSAGEAFRSGVFKTGKTTVLPFIRCCCLSCSVFL